MLKHCLILSARDHKENSLIISVVQPRLGRQEFIAKGGKQTKAKLTPSLQPLMMVNLWIAPTRGERAIIREVEVTENFTPSHPLGLRLALKVAGLLEQAVQPGMEAQTLARAAVAILRRVKEPAIGIEELTKLWVYFELSLLSFLGISPPRNEYKEKSMNDLARKLEQRIYHFLSL